jgi:hypothetical protein
MFKAIPSSDISIRPFKAYKNYTFNETTLPVHAVRNLDGSYESNESNTITINGVTVSEYSLNKSIRTLYYNRSPKQIGTVVNWDYRKHFAKQIFKYEIHIIGEGSNRIYNYYYDQYANEWIDEFKEFLDTSGYYVTSRGEILIRNFTDVTTLLGDMKNIGSTQERFIGDRFLMWSIPRNYVGEGIKPTSFTISNYGYTKHSMFNEDVPIQITDDGCGNLIESDREYLGIIGVDFNEDTNYCLIKTNDGELYNTTVINFDFGEEIPSGVEEINLTYENVNDIHIDVDQFDLLSEYAISISSMNFPYPLYNPPKVIGNIFYANGIVTLTHQVEIDSDCGCGQENTFFGEFGYTIDYKSTKTIYENEVFINILPTDFNISTNPTATTWNGGVQYVNKYISIDSVDGSNILDLDYRIVSAYDGQTKIGFEEYEQRSELDPTGSFLAPYVTTIGLYDDEYNLVAVAKIPTKQKKLPDYPINFIVRFDT